MARYDVLKKEILVDIFLEGIADLDEALGEGDKPTLLILDDLQSEAADSRQVASLFQRGSHHRNILIVNIMQTFFKVAKT